MILYSQEFLGTYFEIETTRICRHSLYEYIGREDYSLRPFMGPCHNIDNHFIDVIFRSKSFTDNYFANLIILAIHDGFINIKQAAVDSNVSIAIGS